MSGLRKSRTAYTFWLLFMVMVSDMGCVSGQDIPNVSAGYYGNSNTLYHGLAQMPKKVSQDIIASIKNGNMGEKEVFLLLVDAIREHDAVPGSDYDGCASLLRSVCPSDAGFLLNALSDKIGPGHAYTNVMIGRFLVEKRLYLSLEDKHRICKALTMIYRHWREADPPGHSGWCQAEMARDGVVVMSGLAPLSTESYGTLLGVLRDNKQTYGGKWLACFLYMQMPEAVTAHFADTCLDILENLPRDDTFHSFQYDVVENVRDRIPMVFGPRKWIGVFGMQQSPKPRSAEEKGFFEWCDAATDPASPKSVEEAIRAMVVKAGSAGLSRVFNRLAGSSHNSTIRLQYLICAAEMTRDLQQFREPLVNILEGDDEPDWMLASKVVRNVEITKRDRSRFLAVWQGWYDRRKPKCIQEGDYRFLFAIGDSSGGLRLLEEELPRIRTLQASPPFYMLFLEDVPYAPSRYEHVLKRLLKADVWWHRCAAIVMLWRYTGVFKTDSQFLERLAEKDPHALVRERCRQLQDKQSDKVSCRRSRISGQQVLRPCRKLAMNRAWFDCSLKTKYVRSWWKRLRLGALTNGQG